MKKIFTIILALLFAAMLPVYAVKWVDPGDEAGIKTGIYVDLDAINDSGNQVTLVYKFTNEKMLEAFSLMDEKQRPLSVCLMQGTIECSSGKPTSFAMLCYDKNGNTTIDEYGSEEQFKKYNQYSNRYSGLSCEQFRDMKKYLTK